MKHGLIALGTSVLLAAGLVACNQGGVIPGFGGPGPMEFNTNRPGGDYNNFNLSSADPNICQASCQTDSACRAWTYVNPGVQGPTARCWLKASVPPPVSDGCCVSGVK